MTKNYSGTPHRHGALSVEQSGTGEQGPVRRDWGRPERESRTPVNMRNQPHRDNGEGVAPPLPYPIVRRGVGQRRRLWDFNGPSLRRSRSCGINPAPRFAEAHGPLNHDQVIAPFLARDAIELLDTAADAEIGSWRSAGLRRLRPGVSGSGSCHPGRRPALQSLGQASGRRAGGRRSCGSVKKFSVLESEFS